MFQSRGMFMGFTGILTVGFALSGWYVGQRILAADAGLAPATQSVPVPVPNTAPDPDPQQEPPDPPLDDGTNIYGLPPGTIP
jgi:hypothetical protein